LSTVRKKKKKKKKKRKKEKQKRSREHIEYFVLIYLLFKSLFPNSNIVFVDIRNFIVVVVVCICRIGRERIVTIVVIIVFIIIINVVFLVTSFMFLVVLRVLSTHRFRRQKMNLHRLLLVSFSLLLFTFSSVNGICFPTCVDCVNPQVMNSTCNACAVGYWDSHCVRACDLRCDPAFGCDKVTGNCLGCPAGKVGNLCEGLCPANCLNNTCTMGATNTTMVCSKGCDKGTYGTDCSKYCNYGCADGTCDRVTGDCACRPEYYGAKCTGRCPSGCALGQGQSANSSTCAVVSDSTELTCLFGCKPRYSGAKDCRLFCPSNCADAPAGNTSSVCDSNAACQFGCKADYYSLPRCNLSCPYSCLASNSTNVSKCDSETGICLFGCKLGSFGARCDSCPYGCIDCDDDGKCLTCEEGKGGARCQVGCNNCIVDAARDLTCDENGCTQCAPGRYGATCESPCENCVDDLCSRDGVCVKGCIEGYSNATGKCDTQCSSGCLASTPRIWRGACDENGTCLNGCRTYLSGAQCDSYCDTDCIGCSQSGCIECGRNAYGPLCKEWCGACVRGCDRNGWCNGDCGTGRYGASCNYSVPDCRLAVRNATPETAQCIECASGFGPNCLPCPKHCAPAPPEALETKPQMCDASGCLHGCLPYWGGARCDMVDTSPDTSAILAGVLPPLIIVCAFCLILISCGLAAKTKRTGLEASTKTASSNVDTNDTANSTPMAPVFVKQQKPVEQQAAFNSKDQTPV
jgi:hypothetical protein